MFAPFIIFGIVGSIIAALIASRRKAANAAWTEAAGRLGIELRPVTGFAALAGNLSMRGTVQGVTVFVKTFQSNDKTHTRYRVKMPSLGLGLKMSKQSPLASMGRFFGVQDIEVGEPLFDKQLMIKGDHPEPVRAFLTPARRVAVSELITAYRQAVVTDNTIEVITGFTSDAEELVSIIQRLVSVAQILSQKAPSVEKLAATRLDGDAGDALVESERKPPESDPWIEFARKTQEAELRYVHGDIKEAAEAFEKLSKVVPADPEIKAWRDKTQRRLKAEDRKPPRLTGDAGSAAEVAEKLFHPDNFSFDTIELFETEYEGKSVRWSGEVKRLRRFDHDRDFGDGPGTKVVFAVHALANDLFAGREIDAIVHLPQLSEDSIEPGETHTFTGTLLRCDPAMRNLFVTDGELV